MRLQRYQTATNLSRSVVLKTHGHLASHHALGFHPAVVSIYLLASAAAPLLSLKISVPSAWITQARRPNDESEPAIALNRQGMALQCQAIIPQHKGVFLQCAGIILHRLGIVLQCQVIALQRSGIVPQHQGTAVQPKGIVPQRLGVVLQRKFAHVHCWFKVGNAN